MDDFFGKPDVPNVRMMHECFTVTSCPAGGQLKFELQEKPTHESTVNVFVNGTRLKHGFELQVQWRSVMLAPELNIQPGDEIVIDYV
jgi:hypothetical protein